MSTKKNSVENVEKEADLISNEIPEEQKEDNKANVSEENETKKEQKEDNVSKENEIPEEQKEDNKANVSEENETKKDSSSKEEKHNTSEKRFIGRRSGNVWNGWEY